MRSLIVYCFVMALAVYPAHAFRKRFEEVLAPSFMACVAVLFVFGFFRALHIGLYAIIAAAVAGTAYALWSNRGDISQLARHVFTPGWAVFTIAFVAMVFVFRNRVLYEWDDTAFWGGFIKESFRLNAFHNVPESAILGHHTYPPGNTLFEYMWLKLYGIFAESHILRGFHVLGASLLLPLMRNAEWKQPLRALALGFVVVALPGVMYSTYYATIYNDVMVGLAFGYGMYAVLSDSGDSPFGCINISLACVYLVLLKDIGFAFALVVIFTYFIDAFLLRPKGERISLCKGERRAWPRLLAMAAPIACFVVWNIYVSGMSAQFDKGELLNVGVLGDFVRGQDDPYKYELLSYFIESSTSFPASGAAVSFPYLVWVLVLFAVDMARVLLLLGRGERRRSLCIGIFMLATGLLYAAGMLYLYLFAFNQYEGSQLRSYTRYMNTFLMGHLLYVVMNIFAPGTAERRAPLSSTAQKRLTAAALAFAVLLATLLIDPAVYDNIADGGDEERIEKRMSQAKAAAYVNSHVDEGGKVYIIVQNSTGLEHYTLSYDILPRRANTGTTFSIGKKYGDGDAWTVPMTADEFRNALASGGYTHVYLHQIDEGFRERFKSVFVDGDVRYRWLYRLRDDGLLEVVEEE